MNIQTKNITENEYNNYTYIYIFGDSHCLCFGHGNVIVNNKFNIQMLNKDSASARGLMNENSTLNYGNNIKNFIYYKKGFGLKPFNSNECNNFYLFKFCQVDMQINYYYKLFVKKENINKISFYEEIINDYLTFLKQFDKYNIMVCGINMPNPKNYKEYLYNCFNKNKNTDIINGLENLSLNEINNDTLFFNNMLKNKCCINDIKYFDLINECTYKIDDKIILLPEYIGQDHHYNGCCGFSIIENSIKIYNANFNINITDYINHPLFQKTYYIFINKLIKMIENINNVYLKHDNVNNIPLLFLLNDIDNIYCYHNNIIKYNIIKYGSEIIVNIDEILSVDGKLNEYMKLFGIKIKISEIINFNVKLNLESNLPIKIYTGKKWINYNTYLIDETIFIDNVEKWRISPSNEYLQSNINKKNIIFSMKIKIFEYVKLI
jgi:hypothetical protein